MVGERQHGSSPPVRQKHRAGVGGPFAGFIIVQRAPPHPMSFRRSRPSACVDCMAFSTCGAGLSRKREPARAIEKLKPFLYRSAWQRLRAESTVTAVRFKSSAQSSRTLGRRSGLQRRFPDAPARPETSRR